MNLSKYIPSMTLAVQITVVFVVLTVTGLGVVLATKARKLVGR